MEDDSSEYGHGETDEESVDNSEQSEQNTDDEMLVMFLTIELIRGLGIN